MYSRDKRSAGGKGKATEATPDASDRFAALAPNRARTSEPCEEKTPQKKSVADRMKEGRENANVVSPQSEEKGELNGRARDEVYTEIRVLLESNSALQSTDFDYRIRQHLHAFHGQGGRAKLHDALQYVSTATSKKTRQAIKNWPAYIRKLLTKFEEDLAWKEREIRARERVERAAEVLPLIASETGSDPGPKRAASKQESEEEDWLAALDGNDEVDQWLKDLSQAEVSKQKPLPPQEPPPPPPSAAPSPSPHCIAKPPLHAAPHQEEWQTERRAQGPPQHPPSLPPTAPPTSAPSVALMATPSGPLAAPPLAPPTGPPTGPPTAPPAGPPPTTLAPAFPPAGRAPPPAQMPSMPPAVPPMLPPATLPHAFPECPFRGPPQAHMAPARMTLSTQPTQSAQPAQPTALEMQALQALLLQEQRQQQARGYPAKMVPPMPTKVHEMQDPRSPLDFPIESWGHPAGWLQPPHHVVTK